MKRAVIIHCWDGNPEYCWYPWIKEELEKLGYAVAVPFFEKGDPVMTNRVSKLEEVVGTPDENLILIGHSVGGPTILRYLERLEPSEKIRGVVMVAGFTDNLGFDELQNFFEEDIDYREIQKHCDHFTFIHSDNDPYVPLEHGKKLREAIGGKVVVIKEAGHFSGDDNCTELPEVMRVVKKIEKDTAQE